MHQHHVPADDLGAAGDGAAARAPRRRRPADAGFEQNLGRLLAQLHDHRFVLVAGPGQRPDEALGNKRREIRGNFSRKGGALGNNKRPKVGRKFPKLNLAQLGRDKLARGQLLERDLFVVEAKKGRSSYEC